MTEKERELLDSSRAELEMICEVAKKHKIGHIRSGDVEMTFMPNAFATSKVDLDMIADELKLTPEEIEEKRKKLEDETLFYSARN